MKEFNLTKEEIINLVLQTGIDIFKTSFKNKKIVLQEAKKELIKYKKFFFTKIPIYNYIDGYYLYIDNCTINKELSYQIYFNDNNASLDFDLSGTYIYGEIKHKQIKNYLK